MKAAAVILAAGRSSRMGEKNKLLLDIEPGVPMVRRVAEQAAKAGVDEVIVVTGHQGDDVEAALAGLDCYFVRNPDFAEGLSTSLKAGFGEAMGSGCDGTVVLLGDMPFVTTSMIDAVLAAAFDNPGRIVQPLSDGKPAHPVWLPAGLKPAIERLTGDTGARHLDIGEPVTVELDKPATVDIDTPESYQAAIGKS